MTKAVMKIEKFERSKFSTDIAVSFAPEKEVKTPRVSIVFTSEEESRILPMTSEIKDGRVVAFGKYDPALIFLGFTPKKISLSFIFSDGADNGTEFTSDLKIENIKNPPFHKFLSSSSREKKKALTAVLFSIASFPFRLLPIRKNRISFFTNRTDFPTGNLKAVIETVKGIDGADVKIICKKGGAKGALAILFKFLYLYMTSKVVFVDDYYHLISYVKKKKKTKLIQLWHGCGAFKTFGFSRFHKDSALEIQSVNHRQYDYAIVSSPEICDYYAEAFGISRRKVLPLGSARCDILADKSYKKQTQEKFLKEFPQLRGKKILLFAPTFRGKGNGDCYYPIEKFNADRVLDILGDDWALAIKLHPYLKEKISFDEKNKNRIALCDSWDINDVLFSVDFLVTDYSSVIFEAALLEIPMAFLAFDLEEYIEKRDFYNEFTSFVPGPIVKTDAEAAEIAKRGEYDIQMIKNFADKSFGNTAGNACNNIKELTIKLLEE